jgi:hypothetical protein
MEAGLVFDRQGNPIHWHLPPDRSAGMLPDSRQLWEILWENRARLGGVAHTHPWDGPPGPSGTDVTTFAAIEAALGRRLIWPIVTFSAVGYFAWTGPGKLDYAAATGRRFRLGHDSIEKLRELSR